MEYRYAETSFPLVECRGCRMRFLGVQPAAESLSGLYDASYFDSEFRCGRAAAAATDEAAFREENRGLLDAFESLGARGRLLDVGCATGALLQHANQRGWQAQGVEPSPEAVAHARARGLEVFHGDLLEARLPAAHFDLVYMGDVLEHVPDCRRVVAEVVRILKPGGWFYLRGPATTHSIARALALALYGAVGRRIVLDEPPYHLWEFTPRPLARLMAAAGLVVTRLRQSKIPPGRARGDKSILERTVMAAIDWVNLPLTALLNVRGDRVVMVARKPGEGQPPGPRSSPRPATGAGARSPSSTEAR
jgi:SAM-dependent methyltransferase